MIVSATNQATVQQTLAVAAAAKTSTGADFNMFLRLLTTQMQNQDPLDPMKTSEYTQQLAQYSQIEQTVQQSATLKEILARLSTQDMAQASGMIGRTVEFDTSVAGLGAEPANWQFSADRSVARAVATITDANGKVVETRIITPGKASGSIDWDGNLSGGGTASAGSYTLTLTATDASGTSVPVSVTSSGIVTNVSQNAGALFLGVNGVAQPLASLRRVATAG